MEVIPALCLRPVDAGAGETGLTATYYDNLDYVNRGLHPQAQLLWSPPGVDYETRALEVAAQADVVVAVMGLSPTLEGEEMPIHVQGFAGGDRTDIELPRPQQELLERIHALGKPIVLVLLNGSALAVNWAAAHFPAIVEAWYPGQVGGEALADVLFGDYNPAGRLPVTFYKSLEDLPPWEDYRMEGRIYRYFRGEPLFPFCCGLSYTMFEFGNLEIGQLKVRAGGQVTVSVGVTNSGDRAGDEIIQLYVRHRDANVPWPIKELKGFLRIALEPGECKTVTFTLHGHQLGYYDERMQYALHPGVFEVMVGSSSQHLPLSGTFEIVAQEAQR